MKTNASFSLEAYLNLKRKNLNYTQLNHTPLLVKISPSLSLFLLEHFSTQWNLWNVRINIKRWVSIWSNFVGTYYRSKQGCTKGMLLWDWIRVKLDLVVWTCFWASFRVQSLPTIWYFRVLSIVTNPIFGCKINLVIWILSKC